MPAGALPPSMSHDDQPNPEEPARPGPPDPAPWHARNVEDVLGDLEVDPAAGLSADEARARLERYGENRLAAHSSRSAWRVLVAQLRSIVVYLLAGAAVLAFATQRFPEGLAVLAVLVINTGIGFLSEWQAVRSMAALQRLGQHTVRVRRAGQSTEIDAAELVPGDLVELAPGGLVPADLRVVEAAHLMVNEASLTGESVPADKLTGVVPAETVLADRSNMLYRGTSVADGEAVGVVVATGSDTELGRIAALAGSAESTAAPLQKRLDELGARLAQLTLGVAALVALIGYFVRESETALVIETALALGIAAIPEGLPIVATIALARGMYVMAQRNALVNRLAAVETLGAVGVIFSDKTGTLTENRMHLRRIVASAGALDLEEMSVAHDVDSTPGVRRALSIAVLCNGASLDADQSEENPEGDPTEVALLVGGEALGIGRERLLRDYPEIRVERFEPRLKKMASFHRDGERVYVAVKGAPDAVLEVSDVEVDGEDRVRDLDEARRERWIERSNSLAAEGLRVLAVAEKHASSEDEEPYEGLCFVGLVGLLDPPRKEVKAAIDRCQAAGVRVKMITGDQPETAAAIAHAVGIVGDPGDPEPHVMVGAELAEPGAYDGRRIVRANIFARVSPEQKLELVDAYQRRGEVVAMTGDGVNDAPALKKADIGIAMGKRGTEAAKQVADMVLEDDAFESIVAAVEQGRVIFSNIRRAVMFMLTTNVAEVMAVGGATIAGWTLPLLPLQILYLNLLTDVFPALALGVSPASGDEMSKPPRSPDEPVLTRAHWLEITGLAAVLAACVLGSLFLAERWLGLSEAEAVTVSFLTIAFGKLWFTFTLRSPSSGRIKNEVTRNPWVWAALALCIALLGAAVYLPGLAGLLDTARLDGRGWALVAAASVVPFVAGSLLREVRR